MLKKLFFYTTCLVVTVFIISSDMFVSALIADELVSNGTLVAMKANEDMAVFIWSLAFASILYGTQLWVYLMLKKMVKDDTIVRANRTLKNLDPEGTITTGKELFPKDSAILLKGIDVSSIEQIKICS